MTTLGAAIDRRRRLALAPALAGHLACAAAEGPAPAAPPKSDATPPPFVPAPHHALTFQNPATSAAAICRSPPTAAARPSTSTSAARPSRWWRARTIPSPGSSSRARRRGQRRPRPCAAAGAAPARRSTASTASSSASEAIDEGCGDEAPFELRCRPERLELADASGTIAAADVTICAVTEPHPSILWVLLAGGAIVLGDDALRSELELAGLGGAHQRLVRGPTP
ncbi:MAG: hypothetical protein H6710_22500 [Myxococcales bacterium]|nr:hypothetical protein [Myxococcales bacterium]